jgi:hypothetical protein
MAVLCDVIGDAIGEVGGYAKYAMDEGLEDFFFFYLGSLLRGSSLSEYASL